MSQKSKIIFDFFPTITHLSIKNIISSLTSALHFNETSKKTCFKMRKKTCFRRNHDFQMVKQKSSLESAMTVEAARDWKQPTLSATKKSHPLWNIWLRVFFLNSHENKGDWSFFLTNSCIVAVSCDKRGRFEQSTSWILVDSKQGDDGHILYQISLFLWLCASSSGFIS